MSLHPLGQPVVALLVWTMVMFSWMYATRISAMMKAGIDISNLRGTTGRSLDDVLPAKVQWKAHNYNHLLEQPLLFYAVCLLLMLLNVEGRVAVLLAWTYVGLRIAHSLLQVTVNVVKFRFALFFIASLALIGLIGLAGMASTINPGNV